MFQKEGKSYSVRELCKNLQATSMVDQFAWPLSR